MAIPLADKMRPDRLDCIYGQNHLIGPGRLFEPGMLNRKLPSLILWGPPGCGKTTLAIILANEAGCPFTKFSAVLSGVAEVRKTIAEARENQSRNNSSTVLFVDEIHRFNKAQQDSFLPHVESGLIILIGATTENPSFAINAALLSRTRVIVLKPLNDDALLQLLNRALNDAEAGLGDLSLKISEKAREELVVSSQGDGRSLLNGLEIAAAMVGPEGEITSEIVEEAIGKKLLIYDKDGEGHYNTISAYHKALRGSDPDASLYWLARMLEAGEDPLFIARRLVRAASEDVGNADPRALGIAMDALDAYRFLGYPEGELALAQATLYVATAPKSNAAYIAWKKVRELVRNTGALPVPHHIRNAPTGLMKSEGYGRGYKYPHDYDAAVVRQEYMPEKLSEIKIYEPTERGYEKRIGERIDYWRQILNKK